MHAVLIHPGVSGKRCKVVPMEEIDDMVEKGTAVRRGKGLYETKEQLPAAPKPAMPPEDLDSVMDEEPDSTIYQTKVMTPAQPEQRPPSAAKPRTRTVRKKRTVRRGTTDEA